MTLNPHNKALTLALGVCLLYILPQVAFSQNIGIIIDRSLSVEENNRNEAVEIIIDLLQGESDSSNTHNWNLIPENNQLQSPEQIDLRKQKQSEIRSILDNDKPKPLAKPPFKLLTGHFGDLSTVHSLSTESWRTVRENFPDIIREKAREAAPSDPRTHFELAKATVSAKISKNEEFYLFIISDGVEDLENWPVKYYLDSNKLSNLEALSRGDFRDAGKARHLRSLNTKLYGDYRSKDRQMLQDFKREYSELLIGRLSLNAQQLESFFLNQPDKVPVFIYLYHFKPRPKLDPSYLSPLRSSASSPYRITKDKSTIRWQLSSDKTAQFKKAQIQLSFYREKNDELIGEKNLTGKSQATLVDLFPNLEDDLYKVLLTATHQKDKREALCYVEMSNYAPSLQFNGAFAKADAPLNPVKFSRDDELAPLEQEVTWEYVARGKETRPPKTITKKISHYELGSDLIDTLIDDTSPLTGQLNSTTLTSPSVKDILASDEDSEFNESPLPLGGAYQLTLEATWPNGESSTATTYFTLPTPELFLMGNTRIPESAETPRIAKKGDLVKIANWTHGWKDFSYELEAESLIDDSWEYLPNNDDNPLQLTTLENGIAVKVAKNINNPIRYRVKFLPDEGTGLADIIDPEVMSTPDGYIITNSFSWLPIIFTLTAILAIGTIAYHFYWKK